MVGSLNKVWPWKEVTQTIIDRHGELKPIAERNTLPATYEQITGHEAWLLGAIVLAIAGFALIFVVEGIGKKLKK
jgi:putative membrane protein